MILAVPQCISCRYYISLSEHNYSAQLHEMGQRMSRCKDHLEWKENRNLGWHCLSKNKKICFLNAAAATTTAATTTTTTAAATTAAAATTTAVTATAKTTAKTTATTTKTTATSARLGFV